ncbi:uncharacterized protein Dana_GF27731 [Drosophila ananassae]|uniref:DUF4794 domain-containing protein n=1 Tax=Drosophila ananassae TaxID=7217 RepID=A0A0P8XDP4_DROAN|nr:uncharacterized protein LOC26515140 [Drosophila ananassae]KPU72815.1 uncharacterized protein Dana_GF27731 [Drosophila ananassae]
MLLRAYDLGFFCCLLILLYMNEIPADPLPVYEESDLLPRSDSLMSRQREPPILPEYPQEVKLKIDPGLDDNSGGNKFYAEESMVEEEQHCDDHEHTTASGTGRITPSFRSLVVF